MSNASERARQLRHDQTDAERLLWSKLRNRQLGGWKFRRQVPIDRYIVDFVCVDAKLVVELDGGQHAQHSDRDAARTAVLDSLGYIVIRFWNDDVIIRTESVLEEILFLLNRGSSGQQDRASGLVGTPPDSP